MRITTAGELVQVDSDLGWASKLIARASGVDPAAPPVPESPDDPPDVRVRIQGTSRGFGSRGLRPITRGTHSDGRRTLLANACGCGFDLCVTIQDDVLDIAARYRPSAPVRALNALCPERFGLLAGQVLVHYPALWRAGWRGRAPLHAAVFESDAGTPLVAGPGGVGKSTLVSQVLARGARVASDNVCVADDRVCHGLAEPIRTDRGRRPGRRVWLPLTARISHASPDRLIVLERGPRTQVGEIGTVDAARVLTAGTYAAGELRRYWAFASTLALATLRGPAHPPITTIARSHAERLPLLRVRVGDGDTVDLDQLLERSISA